MISDLDNPKNPNNLNDHDFNDLDNPNKPNDLNT